MVIQTKSYSIEDLDPNDVKGGIAALIGGKEQLVAQVDLRAFYKELWMTLIQEGFIDGSGKAENNLPGMPDFEPLRNERFLKFGILPNQKDGSMGEGIEGNRAPGMYEAMHRYIQNPDGQTYDFEVIWFFRKKTPMLDWWYNFKIDIACRDFRNVEIVEGNSKKVFQMGTWEFRNKAFVTPSFEQYGVMKSTVQIFKPLITEERMSNIMLNHIWFSKIFYDERWAKTTAKSYIYNVIDKHFKNM